MQFTFELRGTAVESGLGRWDGTAASIAANTELLNQTGLGWMKDSRSEVASTCQIHIQKDDCQNAIIKSIIISKTV